MEKFANAFRVQGLVSGLQALGLKLSERLLQKSRPLIELDPGKPSGISPGWALQLPAIIFLLSPALHPGDFHGYGRYYKPSPG